MTVLGAAISYVLMMASCIIIKIRMPELERLYSSPGGSLFAGLAGFLTLVAIVACFLNEEYRPGVYGIIVWYSVGIYIFGFMAAIAWLQNLLKKNSLYSKNVKKN